MDTFVSSMSRHSRSGLKLADVDCLGCSIIGLFTPYITGWCIRLKLVEALPFEDTPPQQFALIVRQRFVLEHSFVDMAVVGHLVSICDCRRYRDGAAEEASGGSDALLRKGSRLHLCILCLFIVLALTPTKFAAET